MEDIEPAASSTVVEDKENSGKESLNQSDNSSSAHKDTSARDDFIADSTRSLGEPFSP